MRNARITLFMLATLALASTVWAQAAVTAADVNRLDATVTEIAGEVERLRTTDPTLAAEVERSLATLREDVIYLRVKLRRDEVVTREEYGSLRDRLETLRVRASGGRVAANPVLEDDDPMATVFTVPVGTELDIRLQTPLSSGTAKVEDRFEATTMVDFEVDGQVVIPAGTIVRGFVSSVSAAGRIERRGSLTLSFDEIRFGTRSQRLRASVTEAGEMDEDYTRVGVGAAVGGIIGGLFGGGKGALLGVLVGGGGTIAATEGSNVDLPAGTVLRIRLDEALEVIR